MKKCTTSVLTVLALLACQPAHAGRITMLISFITPIALPGLVLTLLILRTERASQIACTVAEQFSHTNVQNPVPVIIQHSRYSERLPCIVKTA